jgi:uncharacterized protein YciI
MGKSMSILSKSDRKKILAVVVLQVFLSALDLLGVLAIGLLGALSVSGVQSREPGLQLDSTLRFLTISEFSFQTQVAILAVGALLLLVGRTILSIIFTRRILFFFSRRGAKISANLISRLLSQPLLIVQARTSQETLYAVTSGVSLITLQILATGIVMVADLSLLLVMTLGIFLVDPFTAIGSFLLFTLIGYFLYRYMHLLAGYLGVKYSELSVVSNEKIVEVFGSYRESVVRNRRDYYAREIGKIRFALAEVEAVLKQHFAFLDHYYEQKKFLASGRRENRVGGVILVLSSLIQEAEEIMKNDPFYIHDVADYDFMWFEPSKSLEEIKEFV